MNQKVQNISVSVAFALLATLSIASSIVNQSVLATEEDIITMKSKDVMTCMTYEQMAEYQVYEDADLAVIPMSDIPYLAHYENAGNGMFEFQEWVEEEDEITVNEFKDYNEYEN